MGMAASQARFLQLTARRSNIEYMGQQINQQRTALANQSAGLFERMLALDPPVPPSSLDDQYYTQGYNFKDTVRDDGTAVFRGDDIQKKVTWKTISTAIADGDVAGTDAVLDVNWTDTGAGAGTGTINFTYADLAGFTNDEGVVGEDEQLAELMTGLGIVPQDDTQRTVLRYVTIEHKAYDPDGEYITVQEQAPAILEFDNLERLVDIHLLNNTGEVDMEADFTALGGNPATASDINDLDPADTSYSAGAVSPVSFNIGEGDHLTYSGQFDEDAFNNDMNKYEFQKAAYDYQLERINIETAQIQKQDKSLELKMKQLDTDHKAVQTEMEAVQKVIQKNIESSFKTFA